jgi:sigma-B regulation protein RsbU (phosphoserine phosphatase)
VSSMPAESGVAPAPARPAGSGWRVAGGVAVSPNDLQLSLFPRFPLPATRHPLDVHAISIPARAFTGDFYVVYRAEGRLWFALGDVAGKGINAAVIMAMIQEELEELTYDDPSAAMLRLHLFLRPLLPSNRFATAVIGYVSDDGTLKIANAGHCTPIIVRATGEIDHVDSTGPVVGVLSSSHWRTFETALGRGDALILYSDGVLEARSADGEDFGVRRVAAALRGQTSREIAESILAAVNDHSGGAREDDLTLLAIKR